jgi:hypothetical protein
MALLSAGDSVVYSTLEVDKMDVFANIQALISQAADISEPAVPTPSAPGLTADLRAQ